MVGSWYSKKSPRTKRTAMQLFPTCPPRRAPATARDGLSKPEVTPVRKNTLYSIKMETFFNILMTLRDMINVMTQ